MMKRIATFALTSMFALAACSAGSQTASPTGTLPQAPNAVTPAAAPALSAAPDQKRKKLKLVPIRIVVSMPHKKKRKPGRHGRYISPGSTQIVITLNTVNGETPPQGLLRTVTTELTSGPGGNCTAGAGTQSCTVSGPAVPVGVDNITFNAEDAFDHSLSAVTQNFTVHAGQANSFSASLLGVPNSFTLYTSGLTAGTPVASQGVTLKVYDAAGDQIVGPANFSQTIQLQSLESVYDTFGAAKLSVNGGTAGSSVNVTNPDDTVTLSYSGLSITPFELEAGASGASPALQGVAVTNVDPVAVCSDAGASVCASGPQVNLYNSVPLTGSTANLTLTQLGFTGSPYLQDITETDTCGAAGANIASITLTGSTSPGGNGSVFAVSTIGTPAQGANCTITFTGGDPLNSSVQVPVTYTTTGISVNGRHHGKITPHVR
jgi:hypothetical protein